MKQTLFIFFSFIIATSNCQQNYVNMLINRLEITNEEIRDCISKTNVTFGDIMNFGQVIHNNLQTTDLDNSILQVGCLFACIGNKKEMIKDADINVANIKMKLQSKKNNVYPLAMNDQQVDTCINKVKDKTDECEIGFHFVRCLGNEMHRTRLH